MHHRLRDMEQFNYKDFAWERYCPGAQELISELMPLALGYLVQVTFFVNAYLSSQRSDYTKGIGTLYLGDEFQYQIYLREHSIASRFSKASTPNDRLQSRPAPTGVSS
jgi:hypothetical protein